MKNMNSQSVSGGQIPRKINQISQVKRKRRRPTEKKECGYCGKFVKGLVNHFRACKKYPSALKAIKLTVSNYGYFLCTCRRLITLQPFERNHHLESHNHLAGLNKVNKLLENRVIECMCGSLYLNINRQQHYSDEIHKENLAKLQRIGLPPYQEYTLCQRVKGVKPRFELDGQFQELKPNRKDIQENDDLQMGFEYSPSAEHQIPITNQNQQKMNLLAAKEIKNISVGNGLLFGEAQTMTKLKNQEKQSLVVESKVQSYLPIQIQSYNRLCEDFGEHYLNDLLKAGFTITESGYFLSSEGKIADLIEILNQIQLAQGLPITKFLLNDFSFAQPPLPLSKLEE